MFLPVSKSWSIMASYMGREYPFAYGLSFLFVLENSCDNLLAPAIKHKNCPAAKAFTQPFPRNVCSYFSFLLAFCCDLQYMDGILFVARVSASVCLSS